MSKVVKRNIQKTFRLIDFNDKYEGEDRNKFYIQMFGINELGETCSIIIDDYEPFFYLSVGDDWGEREVKLLNDEIMKKMKYGSLKTEIVKHKKLYGFTGGKEFKFVKLTFENTMLMNKVKYLCENKYYKFKKEKLYLYESNIPPLLRYFHINKISPSGWIQINVTKAKKIEEKITTCKYEYMTKSKYIVPLPEKETIVPYKICSYDIEASSSHGDFPVPIKYYKRLAMNIYDIYNILKPKKEQIKDMLKKIILTAFEYGKFEGVDKVYPKEKYTKLKIEKLIKDLLDMDTEDEDVAKNIENIRTLDDMFEKMKDEDEEDNNFVKKNKKRENDSKTTIIDLLENKEILREEKIIKLDGMLTQLFPRLEGDKVTFIGSTFMNYGDKEPELNHCLVLGDCDKIDGIVVESCKTEEELLIKWRDLILQEDPDIIIGYNIFGFDYEFMYRRAQENHCETEFLKISRNRDEQWWKLKDGEITIENTKVLLASGEYDLKYFKLNGRLQIDMYTYFRRDFNLSSYKLDDVAGEFISDDIDDVKTLKDETELYTKNITGLNVNDYIHIQKVSFTTDYYDDGKKLKVKRIENKENGINVIIIEGEHNIESKNLKWGMAKDDVTPQDIFRLSNGDAKDRAIVAKYCIQDCNLVHHLMRKIDVITGYVEMASICSVPISFLVFRGQGIKLTSYVAKKCSEKNTLMPDIEKGEKDEGYEGAIVLPPKCSMYMENPVACVDYASLYPSSMISQNYSHDSKVWTKEYNLKGELIRVTGERDKNGNFIYDNLPEYEYIDIEFDTFKYVRKSEKSKAEKTKSGVKICRWAQLPNDEKSIMPAILEELLKARKATKKLMKNEKDPFMENILDKRQLGYKVTANSLYGQCGAKTSTFYEKDVAASTTATGRMMIIYAKRIIEEVYGDREYETKEDGKVRTRAEYVYGDTDSVFFTFNLENMDGEKIVGKEALKLTIEIAQDAADLCTSFLKPPMGLEYEKTLMPFILLSKKRYVGMLYETNPNKGKLKFMGLSLKRRDSCDYLKDTYGEILNILMKENNVEAAIKYLNRSLTELIEGKVMMDKLSITRALKSDYKNPNQIAHKVLADRIGERDPGNKPKPGDRIKYVFILNPTKKLLGERIETPQYISDHKIKIDYTYYITNQLMKPLQQLFGLALVQIWDNNNKKSAIRDYHKEIKKIEKESNNDYEVFMKKKEKYCSEKIKILLFDKILNKISNEKNNLKDIKSYFLR